jgi:Ca2+-transporting ATPase
MNRPPRDPALLIVTNRDWGTISIYAAAMTLAVIAAVLFCSQTISNDPRILNNVAFITLACAQLFHVFNMSSYHRNPFVNEITRNRFVWMALVICALLLAVVHAIPALRQVLGLEVLSFRLWAVALVASLLPLVLVQVYRFVAGSLRGRKG